MPKLLVSKKVLKLVRARPQELKGPEQLCRNLVDYTPDHSLGIFILKQRLILRAPGISVQAVSWGICLAASKLCKHTQSKIRGLLIPSTFL